MRETAPDVRGQENAEESAFSTFYSAHYGAVVAYLLRRCDEATARDVAAETFLTAWRRCDLALPRGLPWLYTTAGLTLRNHQRSQRRLQATTARLASHPPPSSSEHCDPADHHADRDAVRRAVRTLPAGERELLMLTVWEHLDVATAARVAGCSTAAAHVRLHRARRRLRALLEHDEAPRPAKES